MPKFLIKAVYKPAGIRRLSMEGGTKRRTAVREIIESVGGTLECFYFAYGEEDAIMVAELPDVNAGLSLSLTVNASEFVRIATTLLITPEEMDAATK